MVPTRGRPHYQGTLVFYLLGESEERRLDAGELRRVLHTVVDRVVLDPS